MNWLILIVAGLFEVVWVTALKMSNGFRNPLAGAVVTHDIPDNSLAFGVPAKVVRKIENAPVER